MQISKKLKSFVDQQKIHDSFWIEDAKLAFAISLETQRKKANLNYSELAKKLATSSAYITKVFRGDANLTIESMSKLARAMDAELKIEIIPSQAVEQPIDIAHASKWSNLIPFPSKQNNYTTNDGVSSCNFSYHDACNEVEQSALRVA